MQIQRSLPPSMAANVFAMRYGSVFGLLLALTLGVTAPARAAYDTTYLMGLLQSTPDGGWVKINTNKYPDAWPTGSVASPNVPSGPASIVYSWSSFGWDSNNGYLTLFGGGHANYIGNEVYRVSAATGLWERGSLSSKTDQSTWAVVDGLAPQSSHTWDNNIFLPVNNRFVTFGGPWRALVVRSSPSTQAERRCRPGHGPGIRPRPTRTRLAAAQGRVGTRQPLVATCGPTWST